MPVQDGTMGNQEGGEGEMVRGGGEENGGKTVLISSLVGLWWWS